MENREYIAHYSRGFTIPELMITLALAAVVAAIAVPNMRDFVRNNRLASASNDLLHSFQVARSEAIKRQRVVAVCASANPFDEDASCSNAAFASWIVFEDINNNWERDDSEDVLERKTAPTGVLVRSNNNGVVSYAPTGFANSTAGVTPTSAIVVCDERGNAQIGDRSTARALNIGNAGRASVTRYHTEVSTAITQAGACP